MSLLLALLLAPAAAGWADFAPAFPVTPCPDGWAACRIDGVTVDAEPSSEGGVPTPSDLRVGWFSLEGRPGFDPFTPLSAYDGPPMDPPPTFHVEQVAAVAPPEPSPGRGPISSPSPAPTAPAGPAVEPPPTTESPIARVPAPGCGDPDDLHPRAMLGNLTDEERGCLEDGATSGKQTSRDKHSRVLIADAHARRDKGTWAKLVHRHLSEIDRSDPALALVYAAWLHRQGEPRAEAVVRWADVALENRHLWTGTRYVQRTTRLRQMKAEAAGARWAALRDAAAAGETVDPGAVETWRARTVTYAREWYDYATEAGQRADVALSLCASAAGTADACRS